MEWAECVSGTAKAPITWAFSGISLQTDFLSSRNTMGKISTMRWEKTRWCLLRVPNASLAQEAGMDEETITDMF